MLGLRFSIHPFQAVPNKQMTFLFSCSLSLSHACKRAPTYTHTCSYGLTLTHALTHALTRPFVLTHAHTLTHSSPAGAAATDKIYDFPSARARPRGGREKREARKGKTFFVALFNGTSS